MGDAIHRVCTRVGRDAMNHVCGEQGAGSRGAGGRGQGAEEQRHGGAGEEELLTNDK
ncbi:MAG: hypothetical protein RM368_26220 [Nostoc sp. DedSLP03]|nr:hypothetical protein [Nostoc sp. DedSLP03]